MSDADRAYRAAQRLIAEALTDGRSAIGFNTQETRALAKIPPEIAGLQGITRLVLTNTQISDISALESLKEITALYLTNTQVADLTPIVGMIGIRTLYLANTQVADLTPIMGMREVTTLRLSNTLVVDLTPISGLTGIAELYLDDTDVTNLAPIANLTGITELYLGNTKVSDLSPLVVMTEITRLDLNNTQVKDMRPLVSLTRLAEAPEFFGLTFKGSLATRMDAKLAKLSELEDTLERGKRTLTYLGEVGDDWLSSSSVASMPIQDTILTVTESDDGRLDVSPSAPDAGELADAVKAKAHALLQQATKSLEQTAGNMHPRLSTTARILWGHINCPLQDVDMLDVHFELEALRGTYERRGERKGEDIFGDDVIDALDKVLMIGPGLVLDNAEVEKLEARRDRYRGEPPTPDVQNAQDRLSDGIALDPALFGDTIRGYSVTFKDGHAEGSERLRAGQRILNKNTLIAVGTIVVSGIAGGPLSVVGNDLLAWFIAQSETISILAPTWGTAFEAWITPIVMRAREANVAARGILKRPE